MLAMYHRYMNLLNSLYIPNNNKHVLFVRNCGLCSSLAEEIQANLCEQENVVVLVSFLEQNELELSRIGITFIQFAASLSSQFTLWLRSFSCHSFRVFHTFTASVSSYSVHCILLSPFLFLHTVFTVLFFLIQFARIFSPCLFLHTVVRCIILFTVFFLTSCVHTVFPVFFFLTSFVHTVFPVFVFLHRTEEEVLQGR